MLGTIYPRRITRACRRLCDLPVRPTSKADKFRKLVKNGGRSPTNRHNVLLLGHPLFSTSRYLLQASKSRYKKKCRLTHAGCAIYEIHSLFSSVHHRTYTLLQVRPTTHSVFPAISYLYNGGAFCFLLWGK